MDTTRKIMQFHFIAQAETATHYHQNPEMFYVLRGNLDIKIDDKMYKMQSGDIVLINANKRHTVIGNEELLGARFEIDFHLLAEYMGSMQLLFWCNTVADRNHAYSNLRRLLDRILTRYFEKDDKSALYLNALYFETLYVLTSNFLVKADDVRLNLEDSQDRMRIRQIQNYVQANYQSQISLNDLADRLYLSNAYLSKYIKKNLGMTFMEYLNNVRLFHAVDELMYSDKNLTHIAYDNGFPTSASFTKAFREIYNESPSEYRKKIQDEKEKDEKEKMLQQEEEQRILEYLKFRAHKENPQSTRKKEYIINAGNVKDTLTDCSKAISIGDGYLLLQSEAQHQVEKIQKQTGVKYARIWNILSREYCFSEKEGYNFRRLDQVLDFLLDHHMKPYLEVGSKPSLFMYTPERSINTEKSKMDSYDFKTFSEITRELCVHLVNRYGVEELETWYFEYWNDPSLNITEPDGEYYQRFDLLYQTMKNYSEEISVGGAGFILGYETLVCKKIFPIWKAREIHPDFLSVCSFQYIALVEDGGRLGRKSIDSEYMLNQIEIMKNVMEETGFQIPEFHIDEWNFTISNRNVLNDSCEQGAYILKNCIEMNGAVDMMAYWHALDLYSDYYDTDTVLNGDSGLISRDGICKPSFYAFQFMNRLLPKVLEKNDHAIVTTNGRNRYVIACHNYKSLSSRYVFTDEDEIQLEDIEQYVEDIDPIKLNFTIQNVKDGKYLVKIYRVNRECGSVQDLWKNLDYSKGLMRDEVDYLKSSAIPGIEMKTIEVENGELCLTNNLEMQEIRLIDVQYRYDV
ncbi:MULTISPECIES: GH39 family glycosyl hydrolase [Clostridia]|uniref:GH39 family glycosyl hydrolase n=1 Tax=Clostridia TaxID=186801 RepID=UPI000EB01648|nr:MULTISPECIES: helix-turn-helix domain-containing protein [Clostridia]RKQ29780.1 helix-turn-helix domain-containing protein [Ruminococcus sp. B05]TAP33156.1 helix-turn-helix domain-containing protein [Mediterraneibacter sp. gm002]